MNNLPDDIQDTIYRYKHQIEFRNVMNELNDIVDLWCDDQLICRYCKARHEGIHKRLRNEFKCLNDYEEHLFVDLKCKDILDIINEIYLF
jgi:hypothetical protein